MTLTGGTGDVNPQWLVTGPIEATTVRRAAGVGITMLKADAVAVQLPISRVPLRGSGNRATVLEVLKAEFILSDSPNVTQNASAQEVSIAMTISTSVPQLNQESSITNPTTIIAAAKWGTEITPNGVGIYCLPLIERVDVTDGAGHGVLVAVDRLYCTIATGTSLPAVEIQDVTGYFRFLYRMKEIGLQEYLGIVQAQQAPLEATVV